MWSIGVLVLGAAVTVLAASTPFDANRLTHEQLNAVGALRNLIGSELKEEFMAEDYYLAGWLNKYNFNVEKTLVELQKDLKWRDEQKLSSILSEDWKDMKARFPFSLESSDKTGSPVLYVDYGKWDVAKYLTEEGDSAINRYKRYSSLMLTEQAKAHVRQLRSEGRDVTQFMLLYNLDGVTPATHNCAQCSQLFGSQMSEHLEHPSLDLMINRVMFVNMPASYIPMMTQNYKDFEIYGEDRNQWEAKLLEYVERDQFPENLLR